MITLNTNEREREELLGIMNSKLQSVIICSYCKDVYDSPVELPCKNTICRDDLLGLIVNKDTSTAVKTYQCPFCYGEHSEPLKLDLELAKLVNWTKERTADSNNNSQPAKQSDRYVELSNQLNAITSNPSEYIDKAYDEIKSQIEKTRKHNLQVIEGIYDDMLVELTKMHLRCSDNQASQAVERPLPNLDEAKLADQVKAVKNALFMNKQVEFKEAYINRMEHSKLFGELHVRDQHLEGWYSKGENIMPSTSTNPRKAAKLNRQGSRSDGGANSSSAVLTNTDEEIPNEVPGYVGDHCVMRRRASVTKRGMNSKLLATKSMSGSNSSIDELNSSRRVSPNQKSSDLYLVLFDYEAKTKDELTIRKGDVVEVKDSDKNKHGVWLATLVDKSYHVGPTESIYGQTQSNQGKKKSIFRKLMPNNNSSHNLLSLGTGQVYANYLDQFSQVQNEDWYLGTIKRAEAEQILKSEINMKPGSFLVRLCDAPLGTHCYSLSVCNSSQGDIKHYKILREMITSEEVKKLKEPSYLYYIAGNTRQMFRSLDELIKYYQGSKSGLCCRLGSACIDDYI